MLQLGHARTRVELLKLPFRSFNWATRVRAWKSPADCRICTEGRCFNWATRVRAWKFQYLLLRCRGYFSFNWATRVRAWKCIPDEGTFSEEDLLQLGHARTRVEIIHRDSCCLRAGNASIGPRAYARGNIPIIIIWRTAPIGFNWATRVRAWKWITSLRRSRQVLGFNWATRVRAWKSTYQNVVQAQEICFNWATRVRAWKYSTRWDRPAKPKKLQLGHARTRVEM